MIKILKRLPRAGNKKAQSLAEYAILLGIITAALVSMQAFMKARVQSILYDGISQIGDPDYVEDYDLLVGETQSSEFNTSTKYVSYDFGFSDGSLQTNPTERIIQRGTTESRQKVE